MGRVTRDLDNGQGALTLAKEEKVEEVDERAQSREGLWIYNFISHQFVHVNQVFICPYLHLFEWVQ